MKNTTLFDIKLSAILKVLLVVFLVWLAIQLRTVLIIAFIAFIIATAIRPLVKRLQKYRIPRGLSVAIIYLFLIIFISTLIYLIANPLAHQLISLSHQLPEISRNLQNNVPLLNNFDLDSYVGNLKNNLNSSAENLSGNLTTAIGALTGVFDIFTSLLTIVIISLYLTLGLDSLVKGTLRFVPSTKREKVMRNFEKVEEQVGAWLRGQLILMIIIGVTTFIALKILGVPFAGSLAIFAGFMEILPIVGPLVYSVVIILVAFTVSPLIAILAAIVCLIIQQLEGHVIVPITMKKAVGLSPVTTIIAILSGATLLGVVGALLAVPVAAVLSAIIEDLYIQKD